MKNTPLITCAILCYNYGHYLQEAIESCLGQAPGAYRLEVLVLDDGSTDNTPEVCARYEKRIRVSRTVNQGFDATLTRAVREAEGDYVALLDADDLFRPGKLARIAREFARGVLFVSHDMDVIDSDSAVTGAGRGGNTSTVAFARIPAQDLLPVGNEIDFHLLGHGGGGVHLAERLSAYRIHPRSMTDRSASSVHARYFSRTKLAAAAKGRRLAAASPAWLREPAKLRRACDYYDCLGHTEELEARLNERNLLAAVAGVPLMLGACLRNRSWNDKCARMLGRLALRTLRAHFWKPVP